MNVRQAIALAFGTVAALILVLSPRYHTPLRQVSVRQVDGTIITTRESHLIFWQPGAFAAVVLVTGVCVYSLRRKV